MKRFFTTSRAAHKESSDCGAFAETERKDAKVRSLSLSLSLSLSRQDRSGLDNAPPSKKRERFGEHNFSISWGNKKKARRVPFLSLLPFAPIFCVAARTVVFLLTVWTLVAAVTFVPAREDDNMVMTLLIIRFLWGGADQKTPSHDPNKYSI